MKNDPTESDQPTVNDEPNEGANTIVNEETNKRGDAPDEGYESNHPAIANRDFSWRGWVLVGVIIVAFVISPLIIRLIPPGDGYLFALIVVPLVPAVILAITAVWATTRP